MMLEILQISGFWGYVRIGTLICTVSYNLKYEIDKTRSEK